MDGKNDLIASFIERCFLFKDVHTAYEMTIEFAENFYFKDDLEGFMDFYITFKHVFEKQYGGNENGITAAV